MIDYIKGEICELTPTSVCLDNSGIGYYVHISLNTYSALTGKKDTMVYIHEIIREDAHLLFGFIDKCEREIFRHLISVSGIGANTARMMLSSMTPQELVSIITSGNSDALKSVKGIGLKTAQRVIVDLKDKIKIEGTELIPTPLTISNQTGEEAVAALVMLGFAQQASQKAVQKIQKESPDCTVENIIKIALKML